MPIILNTAFESVFRGKDSEVVEARVASVLKISDATGKVRILTTVDMLDWGCLCVLRFRAAVTCGWSFAMLSGERTL